ncbi:DUF3159 domain-containing protein [Nocardia sp. NPDC057353]|uniref:DUF3159 domain-containing protein n=1 Tax=Nocardia sp. NPDC057353 TaxID=3346104 RepID=UPI0036415CDE
MTACTVTEPETTPPTTPRHPVLDQLGGPAGMVYTTVPVVVFTVANAVVPLTASITVALAAALLIGVVRRVRGETYAAAFAGVTGVAAASAVTAWTGSGRDFFLIGIAASLAGAVTAACTLLIRRPLTGMLWNLLHGKKFRWRDDRAVLRGHDLATATLLLLFGSRFLVQYRLYEDEATGWLAFARITMGIPLLALALVVVFWAFRRSTRRLIGRPV